jgi:hypothetical protein
MFVLYTLFVLRESTRKDTRRKAQIPIYFLSFGCKGKLEGKIDLSMGPTKYFPPTNGEKVYQLHLLAIYLFAL